MATLVEYIEYGFLAGLCFVYVWYWFVTLRFWFDCSSDCFAVFRGCVCCLAFLLRSYVCLCLNLWIAMLLIVLPYWCGFLVLLFVCLLLGFVGGISFNFDCLGFCLFVDCILVRCICLRSICWFGCLREFGVLGLIDLLTYYFGCCLSLSGLLICVT